MTASSWPLAARRLGSALFEGLTNARQQSPPGSWCLAERSDAESGGEGLPRIGKRAPSPEIHAGTDTRAGDEIGTCSRE